jgi:prevent-host-death family protein
MEACVKSLRLRDAKASLSAVVEAAERGEATTITKRGRPAAVVVSVDDARRLYPSDRPSFAALLMGIPHPIDAERDPSPLREADL